MGSADRKLVVLAAAAVATACAAIVDINEKQPATVDASGASSDADGGSGGASPSAGGSGGETCVADLATDPKHCGACFHDCLGGACVHGRCKPIVLVSTGHKPSDIRVDDAYVYYADQDTRRIRRVAKTGGNPTTVLKPTPYYTFPAQFDLEGDWLYFTVHDWHVSVDGWVGRVPKRGGDFEVLASGIDPPEGPWSLDVDGGDVFVGNRYDVRTVMALDAGGRSLEVLAQTSDPACCQADAICCDAALTLAADATSVYFTAYIGNRVAAIDRATKREQTLAELPAPHGLSIDETHIFFSSGGQLWMLPKTGGRPSALARLNGDGIMSSAVDETHVYYVEFAEKGGSLRRVRKDAEGSVEVLVEGLAGPYGVALDEQAVYFTVQFEDAVMKLAK